MIQVGIIGAGGFAAGELIRCLVHHPDVNIRSIYSESQADKQVAEVHEDLIGTDLMFSTTLPPDLDCVFLCLGHGKSKAFLQKNELNPTTKIIDLSHDFRLESNGHDFLYGLVELNRTKIQYAQRIANPGCFATAIQLGLLPLAEAGHIQSDVHIHAVTGSTGAGHALNATSHFSWRNNNLSVYKPFTHQHLDEISETLEGLQPKLEASLHFLPIRGDFTRGIFATLYMDCPLSEQEVRALYDKYYAKHPFTFVTEKTIHLKQVVNTNNCLIQVQKIKSKVLITSVLDNLLKGAAGQAIQNMNLLFGLPETAGLKLKANFF